MSVDTSPAQTQFFQIVEWLFCAIGQAVAAWVLISTTFAGGPARTPVMARIAGAAVAALLCWVFYPTQTSKQARGRWLAARASILVALTVTATITTQSVNREYSMRAKATELILAAAPYREIITARLRENPRRIDAGKDISATVPPRVGTASVAADGSITITHAFSAPASGAILHVVLSPRVDLASGEVIWTCRGEPANWMPAACR